MPNKKSKLKFIKKIYAFLVLSSLGIKTYCYRRLETENKQILSEGCKKYRKFMQ